MATYGEIIFGVTDANTIEFDLGLGLEPTKMVKKGELIVCQMVAPKNRWLYKIKYGNSKELLEELNKLIKILSIKKEVVEKLKDKYEEVEIMLNIRSTDGFAGFHFSPQMLMDLAELGLPVDFDIIA